MPLKVIRKQQNSKMCLVCGLSNRYGLKARFYELENGDLVALVRPAEEHQGYPNRLHGGIAGAILDETIGRAILPYLGDDQWWVTIELHLKYRNPIPLDQELRVFGRVTAPGDRFFQGSGEIVTRDGTVGATGTGRFMKMPLEKIDGFDPVEDEWQVSPSPEDPEWVEPA